MTRNLMTVMVTAGLITGALPALGQEPASAPAGAGEAVKKMALLLRGPTPEGLQQALAVLARVEKDHPKADEIHLARMLGIRAALQLAQSGKDPKDAALVKEISARVQASDAPVKMKVLADAYPVLLLIRPPAGASPPAGEAEKAIRGLAARHAKGEAAVDAMMMAVQLSELAGKVDLTAELEARLQKEHPDDPAVQELFRYRGKPFQATLTQLDGKKLTLPGDLLGKVVVIDFWATWCGPCVAEVPHMKRVYAAYKPKGVEFVGISLDKDRKKLEAFVTSEGLTWIQTYTGQGWEDPTAQAHGINGIPAMWVVGKDGKVVSDKARGNLEAVLDSALKAPTTRPAAEATTRPAAAG